MSLKARLDELGIKYKGIAELLNKNYDAVRAAVRRESFSDLEYKEIGKKFGKSWQWLKDGTGSPETSIASEPKSGYSRFHNEEAFKLLGLIEQHLPEGKAAFELRKLKEVIIGLYEYKEDYWKVKEEIREYLDKL